ncbi:MAG: DUF4861 domain-containing protein [Bacteroidota bacterium]
MNILRLSLVLALFGFLSACQEEFLLSIQNPSDTALEGKIITLSSNAFEGGKSGEYPILIKDGQTLATQIVDTNKDGNWDELIALMDLEANEEINLTYEWIPTAEYPEFKKRTNVYLGYSEARNNEFTAVSKHDQPAEHKPMDYPLRYQSEGPVWESDIIAFRSYFDARNGKDIFGKAKPDIRAEKIGYNEDYHTLQEWGMDVLKVGTSLGAGALALMKNDSIYRLGVTETSSFEILENGPLMTSFKLTYTGWDIAGQKYGLEEIISIYAGKRWYESKVKLTGASPTDTLVSGIVTLKSPNVKALKSDGYSILYTHGKQGENNDYLGMSFFSESQNIIGYGDAPTQGEGVTSTKLAYLKPVKNEYHFYFLSGWEGEDIEFKKQDYFEEAILKEVKSLSTLIN